MYSEVDIILEYKNMGKGVVFGGEAHTAWVLLSVSKTQKQQNIKKKGMILRLIKYMR